MWLNMGFTLQALDICSSHIFLIQVESRPINPKFIDVLDFKHAMKTINKGEK